MIFLVFLESLFRLLLSIINKSNCSKFFWVRTGFIFFVVLKYSYLNQFLVICSFKYKYGDVRSKNYMYCYIPREIWNQFLKSNESYGKGFNKYISKYKCDCN